MSFTRDSDSASAWPRPYCVRAERINLRVLGIERSAARGSAFVVQKAIYEMRVRAPYHVGKLLTHLKGDRVVAKVRCKTHSHVAVLRWKSERRWVSPNLAVVCPFVSSRTFHAACSGISSPEGPIGLLPWEAPPQTLWLQSVCPWRFQFSHRHPCASSPTHEHKWPFRTRTSQTDLSPVKELSTSATMYVHY